MLSHANFLNLVRAGGAERPAWNTWTEDDVSLVAMPVFHIGGSGWGTLGVYHGATGVIAREFDPNRVLDFIDADRHYENFSWYLPPCRSWCVIRKAQGGRLLLYQIYPLWRVAHPRSTLLRECMEVFKCGFVQMYGMTETTGTIVALSRRRITTRRAIWTACVPPENRCPVSRLRSSTKPDNELPTRQVGEIATRSDCEYGGILESWPTQRRRRIDSRGLAAHRRCGLCG
jgi:acyl-CoA synthetase (AMP-forming)/AMP-acid ligase II